MTIIRTDHPVARKKHICEICGCAIEPGTRYLHQVNTYEGICDIRVHIECSEYEFSRRVRYEDDEIGPDYTSDRCREDLTDILGNRDKADDFMRNHSLYECVKYIQEYGNS